jgi:hypothetical protein
MNEALQSPWFASNLVRQKGHIIIESESLVFTVVSPYPIRHRTADVSQRGARPFSTRRPKLPINDHPPSRNLLLTDPERPHRQPVLIPGQAVSLADRHGLARRFENADRAGNLPVADRVGWLMWAKYRVKAYPLPPRPELALCPPA